MSKRILIVDDDPDILEILDIIFQEEGYEISISETGSETEDIHIIKPDLILLDVKIGTTKIGAEICARIKSHPESRNLPIILLSAEDNLEQISKKCGANDYVSKPFEVSNLLNKVKELLAA